MATYLFECPECGKYEYIRKMSEAGDPMFCPTCQRLSKRIFTVPGVAFHCDGFHATDYFKHNEWSGTKTDLLRAQWKARTGEEAPPPATDVPRNGGEPA